MKLSRYNFSWDIKNTDKILLYNGLTSSLVELSNKYQSLLERNVIKDLLEVADKSILEKLEEGGFVIGDDVDEVSLVEFVYNSRKYSKDTRDITIAPTLSCDFSCIYCFEQGVIPKEYSIMSTGIQNELVKFFEREAKKTDAISVTWFGGEPLLAQNIISSLSKQFLCIIKENDIRYTASIISNGYNLKRNEETIDMLRACKIDGVQITLDGPPNIHNKRRKLRNSTEGTFDTIIENVNYLYKNEIPVTLRINVDKTNLNSVEELLDILVEYDLINIPISLGDVQPDTQSCKFYEESCFSTKQFGLFEREFYQALRVKGFKSGENFPYPSLAYPCVANRLNSIIVDSDGDLYKCRADIGNKEETIGNIGCIDDRTQNNRMREIKWIAWSPFYNTVCRECKMLPLCMGGCGHRVMFDKKMDCTEWKYNIEYYLKEKYISNNK